MDPSELADPSGLANPSDLTSLAKKIPNSPSLVIKTEPFP